MSYGALQIHQYLVKMGFIFIWIPLEAQIILLISYSKNRFHKISLNGMGLSI